METLTPAPRRRSLLFHQISVLLLTFSAYAAFHASRKPPSIVKSVLGPEVAASNSSSAAANAGWPPFDGPRGPHRLGELDLAFLSTYSAGMYLAGHVGDRIDLRRFLAFGMLGSGVTTAAFGMGYWWGVHRLGFFLVVQIVSGLFQSIGWPCVVAVVGNWFGKSKRGLIMGVWNSHTSVGNILGSVVASSVLEFGWGWSFVLPGVLIIVVGAFVFAFLVVDPRDLGFESPAMEVEMSDAANGVIKSANGTDGEEVGLLGSEEKSDLESKAADSKVAAIGFLEAWRLPNVAPYAFCLFFTKLVAYTFLYWLPFYIQHTGCDRLLMPSRFEPCGLNQLYAMRYGTVPVVHCTVGFRDTVENFDPFANEGSGQGTGWAFSPLSKDSMLQALRLAIQTFREHRSSWEGLMKRGMLRDFTWDSAAVQYEQIFEWAFIDPPYVT